jgi:hypothetical protein
MLTAPQLSVQVDLMRKEMEEKVAKAAGSAAGPTPSAAAAAAGSSKELEEAVAAVGRKVEELEAALNEVQLQLPSGSGAVKQAADLARGTTSPEEVAALAEQVKGLMVKVEQVREVWEHPGWEGEQLGLWAGQGEGAYDAGTTT